MPFAPGTAGTMVGIPVYLLLSRLSWLTYLISVLVFSAAAVYISGKAEKILNAKDPSSIVIDEIAGLQFAMFLVSPGAPHILYGFLLFRLFDITKPFPIRICEEKFPGGCGVVADDIVAGIYANMVLLLSIRYLGI